MYCIGTGTGTGIGIGIGIGIRHRRRRRHRHGHGHRHRHSSGANSNHRFFSDRHVHAMEFGVTPIAGSWQTRHRRRHGNIGIGTKAWAHRRRNGHKHTAGKRRTGMGIGTYA